MTYFTDCWRESQKSEKYVKVNWRCHCQYYLVRLTFLLPLNVLLLSSQWRARACQTSSDGVHGVLCDHHELGRDHGRGCGHVPSWPHGSPHGSPVLVAVVEPCVQRDEGAADDVCSGRGRGDGGGGLLVQVRVRVFHSQSSLGSHRSHKSRSQDTGGSPGQRPRREAEQPVAWQVMAGTPM